MTMQSISNRPLWNPSPYRRGSVQCFVAGQHSLPTRGCSPSCYPNFDEADKRPWSLNYVPLKWRCRDNHRRGAARQGLSADRDLPQPLHPRQAGSGHCGASDEQRGHPNLRDARRQDRQCSVRQRPASKAKASSKAADLRSLTEANRRRRTWFETIEEDAARSRRSISSAIVLDAVG